MKKYKFTEDLYICDKKVHKQMPNSGIGIVIESKVLWSSKEIIYTYFKEELGSLERCKQKLSPFIQEVEINFSEGNYLIIQCWELDDQYECDADRRPVFVANEKGAEKFLEDHPEDFYEVYLINEDGSLSLKEELSTY